MPLNKFPPHQLNFLRKIMPSFIARLIKFTFKKRLGVFMRTANITRRDVIEFKRALCIKHILKSRAAQQCIKFLKFIIHYLSP